MSGGMGGGERGEQGRRVGGGREGKRVCREGKRVYKVKVWV